MIRRGGACGGLNAKRQMSIPRGVVFPARVRATSAPMPSPLACHWSLDPAVAYLNHGAFGACPRVIVERQAALRAELERGPVDFLWRTLDARLDEARAEVARLVRAPEETIAFVQNATSGVNAVARSLEFAPGDELLTTDHDYNACRNVLTEVARRGGARVVVAAVPFPLASADEVVAAVLGAVTPRTRLALLDHVTSPTALVFPLAEIIRELSARGVPVLVDGAHAPGMLELDVPALGADYYTGNLHKWVCGPRAAGFLYVKAERQEAIQPAVISHGYNRRRPGRCALHDRFDWQGTSDVTAWLATADAIRWGETLFADRAAWMRHNRELAIAARRLLCAEWKVEPPCPESMLGAMATIPLPDRWQNLPMTGEHDDPVQRALFHEHRIEAPIIRRAGRRYVRVSAHAYNAPDDYARLAAALGVSAGRSAGSGSSPRG